MYFVTKGHGYFGNIIQISLDAEHSFQNTCEAAHEDIIHIRLSREKHCRKKKVRRKTDGMHRALALRQVYSLLFLVFMKFFWKGVNEDTSKANAVHRVGRR